MTSLYSILCKVRQNIFLHFNKKLWPYSLQVRFSMPTLHLMHHWFRSLLIQFDEKRHNGGSDDHDGVDKKGPFMGDTNISPISEARSNSVYLLVLSQVWRDTGTWFFTICFPTFLSCPHKGNISQLCNLLKMTAGPGLPVCQGTPLRTHGQLFPVFSKSKHHFKIESLQRHQSQTYSSSAATRYLQDKGEKQQN